MLLQNIVLLDTYTDKNTLKIKKEKKTHTLKI